MNFVNISNLNKSFASNIIFKDIKLDINDGDRVGIIGRNGEGKTTLLNIISGIESPDTGHFAIKKDISVNILEQIPQYEPKTKVIECISSAFNEINIIENKIRKLELEMSNNPNNIDTIMNNYSNLQEKYLDMGGYQKDSLINKVVHGLKIENLLHHDWETLSGGERTKIELAKILLKKADLLLLDEPTNHLDIDSLEWLTKYINNYNGAVVIVSHDRYFLDDTVNKIFEIEDSNIYIYNGNYTNFLKSKEDRILKEFEDYKNQQKKIKKMENSIKQLRLWASQAKPPSASLYSRAKNMEKALNRIKLVKKPNLDRKVMQVRLEDNTVISKDVFHLTNVSKRYNDKILFSNVNMMIKRNEKIAIVGNNGSGKTTLLNILLSNVYPDEGDVHIAENIDIAYLSQHAFNELDNNKTLIEVFRDAVPIDEFKARHILAQFLFYGFDVYKKIKDLSGGEKMRLRWAQIVHSNKNILILDEPTNHLDIESKEALEEALSQYEGTVIAVSHDRYFLDKYFDTTYWIENNSLKKYNGNYSYSKIKKNSKSK